MLLQIAMARIDRPRCFRDLAADKRLVTRLAGADRKVSLAFGQIKKPVADHELDPQAWMARVKLVDEMGSPHMIRQDRSARHTNGAVKLLVRCGELALECRHRSFNSLGGGRQFLSKLGQAVTREVTLYQTAPKKRSSSSEMRRCTVD